MYMLNISQAYIKKSDIHIVYIYIKIYYFKKKKYINNIHIYIYINNIHI